MFAEGWGGREEMRELLSNGYRVSVLQDERVLEMDGSGGGKNAFNTADLYT